MYEGFVGVNYLLLVEDYGENRPCARYSPGAYDEKEPILGQFVDDRLVIVVDSMNVRLALP